MRTTGSPEPSDGRAEDFARGDLDLANHGAIERGGKRQCEENH